MNAIGRHLRKPRDHSGKCPRSMRLGKIDRPR
jgi:hypothetical protein